MFFSLFAPQSWGCVEIKIEVFAGNFCSKIKTYTSKNISEVPVLVIAIHGDSPRKRPIYQYTFAEKLAGRTENTISVGLLRPGYIDKDNRKSDGVKGKAVGDNYDKPRVDQIAEAIYRLKEIYQPSKVILAGHSGGSAISAKIIAMYPDLIDHAFIIACPCDVTDWRRDMLKLTKYKGFRGNIDVVSPINLVSNISEKTKITLFVGKNDKVTKPYLTEKFHQALINYKKQSELFIIDGDHEIFLDDSVLNKVVEATQRKM